MPNLRATPGKGQQTPSPARSLEAQAIEDAATLDEVATAALAVDYYVMVRPEAARRIARQLRALAALSREAS